MHKYIFSGRFYVHRHISITASFLATKCVLVTALLFPGCPLFLFYCILNRLVADYFGYAEFLAICMQRMSSLCNTNTDHLLYRSKNGGLHSMPETGQTKCNQPCSSGYRGISTLFITWCLFVAIFFLVYCFFFFGVWLLLADSARICNNANRESKYMRTNVTATGLQFPHQYWTPAGFTKSDGPLALH